MRFGNFDLLDIFFGFITTTCVAIIAIAIWLLIALIVVIHRDAEVTTGFVVGKHFEPAHWVLCGKVMIHYEDKWKLEVRGNRQDNGESRTVYFEVSPTTYNCASIGDKAFR